MSAIPVAWCQVRWSHRRTVDTAERTARLVDSIKPPATSAAAPTYTRRRGSSGRPAGPSPSRSSPCTSRSSFTRRRYRLVAYFFLLPRLDSNQQPPHTRLRFALHSGGVAAGALDRVGAKRTSPGTRSPRTRSKKSSTARPATSLPAAAAPGWCSPATAAGLASTHRRRRRTRCWGEHRDREGDDRRRERTLRRKGN